MFFTLLVGLFAPLVGFLFLSLLSPWLKRKSTFLIGCSSILISFLCFFTMLSQGDRGELILFQWIPLAKIQSNFHLHLDHLSLLMTLIVSGVGFLIHVYSVGYMDHEDDYARYFACLNFFIFSMLLLVLAGDILLLFVGWEGVGVASYLLIGFWYHRPLAASAATKAFIVNRIGDWGLLIGIVLTFTLFGTGDIQAITLEAGKNYPIAAPIITLLTLLYFWGAIGKSAQMPLHVWLPDAMEGPTPVSALIHAATMVTAGVYLIVRLDHIFLMAPQTLQVIGFIGALTALFAALSAIGQKDLKRVLAYSTISQLGLMFLATSVGAFYAAMFHLTTHAFVKALLFLSAGNVVHMLHDKTDMEKMGGLYKRFPYTHWLFLIGVLALSGVPPLATFFSKDLIIELEHLEGFQSFYYIALLASILTAFYLTRAYCMTFLGKAYDPEDSYREPSKIMLIPTMILGFLSLVGGFLGFCFCPHPLLETYLQEIGVTYFEQDVSYKLFMMKETWLAIAGAFLGIGVAYVMYTRYRESLRNTLQILKDAFYIDTLYDYLFVKPLSFIAKLFAAVIEPSFFEKLMMGSAKSVVSVGGALQVMQSGQIRSYVAWMVLGTSILIIYIML